MHKVGTLREQAEEFGVDGIDLNADFVEGHSEKVLAEIGQRRE